MIVDDGKVRTFASGATRSTTNTLDPSGFLSAAALLTFCRYMEKHRYQADGTLRASDNWKKGIPFAAYYESLVRHILELMLRMETTDTKMTVYPNENPTLEDTLCAIMFNVQGMLHELTVGEPMANWMKSENENG